MISRQRAWGVPITLFIKEKPDGSVEMLSDPDVNVRIIEAFEEEGADAWYKPGARERFLARTRQRRLAEGRRHSRRLVRFRLDARLRAGRPEHFPGLAGISAQGRRRARHRDVSRRLRPASRLVPVLAPGKLRHARPRAFRRRAHPRLRPRRGGAQNVEIARQRHRAAGRDQSSRAPTSCACGCARRIMPTICASGRRFSKPPSTPTASCATRCAGCSAISRISAPPSVSPTRRCRSSSG